MRLTPRRALALLVTVTVIWGTLGLSRGALAKVFVYSITRAGDLIKYDPDADQIVKVTPDVGQGYINRRNEDTDLLGPSRVLDVSRGRIVTFINEDPGVVLLDVSAKRATEIVVGPRDTVDELRHLVYPRRGSRFYVHWVRQPTPADAPEAVFTAVDFNGQVLGTTPSPIGIRIGNTLPHSDGRSFYLLHQPNEILRLDGETLAVLERRDLSSFYRPGATGQGIDDVREGRALLFEGEGTRNDLLDPTIVVTVDLATRTASPRITTGLGASTLRLVPGARTIVLQEARTRDAQAGAGRLHFYDVATGSKLGTVSFDAPDGAILLGFHPDGRRLFMRVWAVDNSTPDLEVKTRLVIVDVVARTVVRNRDFENIGMAVDFVDEP